MDNIEPLVSVVLPVYNRPTVVDTIEAKVEEQLNYNSLREEASSLWKKMVGEGESINEEAAVRILKRVEMIFGRPMKISEITEDQVDLLSFENSIPSLSNLFNSDIVNLSS